MSNRWDGFSGFHSIFAVEITTIILMTIFTLSRLASLFTTYPTPSLIRKSELLSFFFLLITTALTITQNALTLVVTVKYIAAFNASPDGTFVIVQTTAENKKVFIQLFFHTISIWSLKLCYICQFVTMYRVLPTKKVKAFFIGTSGFTVLGLIISIGLWLGWCRPFSSNWIYTGGTKTCRVQGSMEVLQITTSLNVSADILIANLSFIILRSSQLLANPHNVSPSRALRTAIIIVFLIGILSIIAPLGRYVIMNYMYSSNLTIEQKMERMTDNNITWSRVLARVEVVLGTVAYGCAFGRLLLKRLVLSVVGFAKRSFGSGRSSSSNENDVKKVDRNSSLRFSETDWRGQKEVFGLADEKGPVTEEKTSV